MRVSGIKISAMALEVIDMLMVMSTMETGKITKEMAMVCFDMLMALSKTEFGRTVTFRDKWRVF